MTDDLLKQILGELQSMNQRVTNMETNMATKQDIADMATKQDITDLRVQMNSRFDTLETKVSHAETKLSRVETDVASIRSSVERLESNEPQDILGCLNRSTPSLSLSRTSVRVSVLETDLKEILNRKNSD